MKLLDYLATPVPAKLGTSDHLRLGICTFAATAASVGAVHQFLPHGQQLPALISHSLTLAATYTAWALVVSGLLILLRQRLSIDQIEVWHLWAMSFLVCNLGYFISVPAGQGSRLALHAEMSGQGPWFHYARLLPLWVLMTYVFIQAYTRRALRAELAEFQRISQAAVADTPIAEESIHLACGRKRIDLDGDCVSHISVEDHYCYIHYCDRAGWHKVDVALPLRKLAQRVPASFLRIHRSHIINPIHLRRIEREGRSYRVGLSNDVKLPISRYRVAELLPKVRDRCASESEAVRRNDQRGLLNAGCPGCR